MLTTDGDVDPLGLRAVKQLLADQVCGSADYRQETASTNTLALAELHGGSIADGHYPKLYLADSQTAGRGRHGRSWVSTQGTLTFSVVADCSSLLDQSTKLLSLAVGIGIARTLEFEFAPLKTKLKWPNDVYIAGGKVAGILLETTHMNANRVVIGVGLNVTESPPLRDDPPFGSTRCLAETIGRQVHRYQILQPIVANIMRAMDETIDVADDLLAEFRSRCLLTGQVVSFQTGDRRFEGMCAGVSSDGELIVETDGGARRLQSGEARLVRMGS